MFANQLFTIHQLCKGALTDMVEDQTPPKIQGNLSDKRGQNDMDHVSEPTLQSCVNVFFPADRFMDIAQA